MPPIYQNQYNSIYLNPLDCFPLNVFNSIFAVCNCVQYSFFQDFVTSQVKSCIDNSALSIIYNLKPDFRYLSHEYFGWSLI